MAEVKLELLKNEDRKQFIIDNQEAFNFGAMEEFGMRDNHFEEEGQIISAETIEKSIESGEAYRIICDGIISGGVVIYPFSYYIDFFFHTALFRWAAFPFRKSQSSQHHIRL